MRGIGLATTAPTGTTNFTDPTSGMVSVSATQPFVFTPVYVPGSAAVASYDPPSLAAGDAASSFTVEVTWSFVGDAVTVTLTSVDGLSSFDPAGMQITAYVCG